jgi:hypothetical protein
MLDSKCDQNGEHLLWLGVTVLFLAQVLKVLFISKLQRLCSLVFEKRREPKGIVLLGAGFLSLKKKKPEVAYICCI